MYHVDSSATLDEPGLILYYYTILYIIPGCFKLGREVLSFFDETRGRETIPFFNNDPENNIVEELIVVSMIGNHENSGLLRDYKKVYSKIEEQRKQMEELIRAVNNVSDIVNKLEFSLQIAVRFIYDHLSTPGQSTSKSEIPIPN